jgi:hypothetical protein
MLIAEKMKEQRRFGLRYFRPHSAKFEESCFLASINRDGGARGGRRTIHGWTANL